MESKLSLECGTTGYITKNTMQRPKHLCKINNPGSPENALVGNYCLFLGGPEWELNISCVPEDSSDPIIIFKRNTPQPAAGCAV
jgi:hypothetical protein